MVNRVTRSLHGTGTGVFGSPGSCGVELLLAVAVERNTTAAQAQATARILHPSLLYIRADHPRGVTFRTVPLLGYVQEKHVETAKQLLGNGRLLNDFVSRLLDDIANLKAMLRAISIGAGCCQGDRSWVVGFTVCHARLSVLHQHRQADTPALSSWRLRGGICLSAAQGKPGCL